MAHVSGRVGGELSRLSEVLMKMRSRDSLGSGEWHPNSEWAELKRNCRTGDLNDAVVVEFHGAMYPAVAGG